MQRIKERRNREAVVAAAMKAESSSGASLGFVTTKGVVYPTLVEKYMPPTGASLPMNLDSAPSEGIPPANETFGDKILNIVGDSASARALLDVVSMSMGSVVVPSDVEPSSNNAAETFLPYAGGIVPRAIVLSHLVTEGGSCSREAGGSTIPPSITSGNLGKSIDTPILLEEDTPVPVAIPNKGKRLTVKVVDKGKGLFVDPLLRLASSPILLALQWVGHLS